MNKLEAVFFDSEKAAFLYGIIKESEKQKEAIYHESSKINAGTYRFQKLARMG